MDASIVTEIQERLADVLDGQEPFDDFWDWLNDLELQIHRDTHPRARQLLYRIIGMLDLYQYGKMTDAQLRVQLASLFPVVIRGVITFQAATSTIVQPRDVQTSLMPAQTLVQVLPERTRPLGALALGAPHQIQYQTSASPARGIVHSVASLR